MWWHLCRKEPEFPHEMQHLMLQLNDDISRLQCRLASAEAQVLNDANTLDRAEESMSDFENQISLLLKKLMLDNLLHSGQAKVWDSDNQLEKLRVYKSNLATGFQGQAK